MKVSTQGKKCEVVVHLVDLKSTVLQWQSLFAFMLANPHWSSLVVLICAVPAVICACHHSCCWALFMQALTLFVLFGLCYLYSHY